MSRVDSTEASELRVAIVHDWLVGMRGGERVLEQIIQLFPRSEIFTLFYREEAVTELIRSCPIHAASVSNWPAITAYYRYLLPFYSRWTSELSRRLALRHAEKPFDLVVSVSHCVAKNVTAPVGVPHLCYCLTPMRYIWDQYDSYFQGKAIEPIVRFFVNRLREQDLAGTTRIDKLAVISEFVQKRVEKVWGLPSEIIYPPVATDWIASGGELNEADTAAGADIRPFLCVSALVPYKRVDLIIEAFNSLELPLLIVGAGPEEDALKMRARNPQIRFVSKVSDEELANFYLQARAFVFAAEEDFGMAPVEAQAAGLPVIALNRGGCKETVVSEGANKTGILVSEQSGEAIREAVCRFLDREMEFTVENCREQAKRFSVQRFRLSFNQLVREATESSPSAQEKLAAINNT